MTLDELIEELTELRNVGRVPGFTPIQLRVFLRVLPEQMGKDVHHVDKRLDRMAYVDGLVQLKDQDR